MPDCLQVGCNATGLSEIYSFRTAQALKPTWSPYKIAMWADVGQTTNSSVTLEHMVEADADISILIGDLTYAVSLLIRMGYQYIFRDGFLNMHLMT